VNSFTKKFDSTFRLSKDNGSRIIRDGTFRFGVYSNEIEIFPDFFEELVKVPLELGTDRNVVGNLTDDLQLFHGDCVDFVQNV